MRGKLSTQDNLGHPDDAITEMNGWRDLAATEARLAETSRVLPVTGTPTTAMSRFELKRPYCLAERVSG
jgi:hypothetical protein